MSLRWISILARFFVATAPLLPMDGSATGQDPAPAGTEQGAKDAAGRRFDVMLVLDTSGSTLEATGTDVDGDGVIGRNAWLGAPGRPNREVPTDADLEDSVYVAELMAAKRLVASLDSSTTRIGIVTFAGVMHDRTPPALLEHPLTEDHQAVHAALDRVQGRPPSGATHMSAGLELAERELLAGPGSQSQQDPERIKIIVLLTDGFPTLPAGPGKSEQNVQIVLRVADRLAEHGIRVHVYAMGPEALSRPAAATGLAARTSGYYTPVENPADIVSVIEQADLRKLLSDGDAVASGEHDPDSREVTP